MSDEGPKNKARVLLVIEGREPIELKQLEEVEYDASASTYARDDGKTWCNAYVEGGFPCESADDLIELMTKIRDDLDQRYPSIKAWREALKPLALEPLPMPPIEFPRLSYFDLPIVSGELLSRRFLASLIEPPRIVSIQHDQIVHSVKLPKHVARGFNQRHKPNAPRNPMPPASPFKRARR